MSSRGCFASPADFPLHDCSAYREGYTYAAEVWALSLVQGAFSVAPCQTLLPVRFATFPSPYATSASPPEVYRLRGLANMPLLGTPRHDARPCFWDTHQGPQGPLPASLPANPGPGLFG
jgi:hypothetical protein